MLSVMPLVLRIAALLVAAEGLRTRLHPTAGEGGHSNEGYTFDAYVRDFGRVYVAGSEEYARRDAIFQDSLSQIRATNSREDHSWAAGVHPFMDWTGVERSQRLHGYKPSRPRRSAELGPLSALQMRTRAASGRVYGEGGDSFEAEAPPVRNQGQCGSCWAIAAVEAVEGQLMKTKSTWFQQKGQPRLSTQALLDCVQNPKHCGGNGGCEGATPQLAYEFMQSSGLPLEADMPYRQESSGKCSIEQFPSKWTRVTVNGWRTLASNMAQPLMQALVELGPVVVSVYAHGWYSYQSGVFDDCPKDAIPNHSVLLRGYGVVDSSVGINTKIQKYWLLQNSWGGRWGEQGTIRIIRQDDEDSWCGIDSRPQEGSACDDEANTNVTVCGSCGLLYDSVIPQVGEIVLPERPADAHANMEVQGIWESYHAAVADSGSPAQTTTQVTSTMAPSDSYAQRFGSSHATDVPPVEPVSVHETSNSFMKLQELLSHHSAAARSADADIVAADALPTEEDFDAASGSEYANIIQPLPRAIGPLMPTQAEGSQTQADASLESYAGRFASEADAVTPGWRPQVKAPSAQVWDSFFPAGLQSNSDTPGGGN